MNGCPLFDPDCRRCARLAGFLDQVQADYPAYHARPVAPFGVADARLLIVGLAPGMHGANATGRPFTGDYAGILLYETLYDFGLSNRPQSLARADGLQLRHCRITNAVKCLPPQNKPLPLEVATCNVFLARELAILPPRAVILALGGVAHSAVLRALGLKLKDFPFGHATHYALADGRQFLSSYHCSRYNTQTRRLTRDMFRDVVRHAVELMP
jgi:uracil-DNA glycosylase